MKALLGADKDGSDGDVASGLDNDTMNLLQYYERKCVEKTGSL